MSIPANCPICSTVLDFPEYYSANPLRCPACNARFMVEGKRVAHLSFNDYYKLLEIDPRSSHEEVKKALRAKILQYHPDRNPDDPQANDRMREVLQAKELLGEPSKRKTYDSVYFAKSIPIWTGRKTPQASSGSYSNRPESSRKSQYEEMVAQAKERSRTAAEQDIEHLIAEINAILSIYGRNPSYWASHLRREVNRIQWGLIGAVIGGIAGLIAGLSGGHVAGSLILAAIGALIGWFLGTYSGELASLLFLIGRLFVAGYLMGFIAARLSTGSWTLGSFSGAEFILVLSGMAGALIMGLLRLSMDAISSIYRLMLGFSMVRQALIGAWGGALIMLFLVLVIGDLDDVGQKTAYYWFALYSLYLFIDSQFFGRLWIIDTSARRRS